MKNIFSSLAKNGDENQFTEAFSIVMQDINLCFYILQQIFNKHYKKRIDLQKSNDMEIATQVHHLYNGKDNYIDMQINFNKNYLFFIENKIKEQVNEKQLNDYLDILKGKESKEDLKCFLILITKNRIEDDFKIEDPIFLRCRWFEVYEYINKYASSNLQDSVPKEYTNQFLEYMRDIEMVPFKAFTSEQLGSWGNYMDFDENSSKIFEEIEDIMRKKGYSVATDWKNLKDYKGFYFYPENWGKWKKYKKANIQMYFELEEEPESKKKCVWCSVSCYLKKDLENTNQLKKAYDKLENMRFTKGETEEYHYRWEKLESIIRGITNGEKQKKAIVEFFEKGLKDIENSGWIKSVNKII